MSLLFLWRPAPGAASSLERFEAVLERERARYERLFGRPFQLERERVGAVCVGLIHFDLGVSGWHPHARDGTAGLLWSGICEEFLGASPEGAAVRELVARVEREPKAVARWDGRFALCTWNTESGRVTVTPGAVEGTSLWHTEGPNGWAMGSRAWPLLELTGRPAVLDTEAASGFAAFEYLVGEGLLAGVRRLRPRERVVIEGDAPPAFQIYVSLSELLTSDGPPPAWRDRLASTAERMIERIRRQLHHSPSPIVLLSGGYDSRCVLAAAARAGYGGAAYTSGAHDSPDVVFSTRVTRRLGIAHKISHGNAARPLDGLVRAPERVLEWTRWTEGTDVLRQALPYRAFFEGQRPFPASKVQLFHGFGGGLLRGVRYMRIPGAQQADTVEKLLTIVRGRGSQTVALRHSAEPLLLRGLSELAAEVSPRDVTSVQWLSLFTWQSKCLRWGADMFAARDAIDWHWTPYMDRTLLRLTWDQTEDDRMANRLLVNLAAVLQPALENVEYIGHGPAPPAPRLGFLGRKRQKDRVAAHRRLWDATLRRETPRLWDRVVSPQELARLYEQEPLSEVLWCLATVESAARAFQAAPVAEA
jgi:hypothetical protein